MRWAFIALGAFAFTGCAAASDHAPPDDTRLLRERVDSLFASHDNQTSPGYAVAIVRDGKIVLASGYGLADLETHRAITPDTPFNLASLSKQFTGAAVALEIGAGRMSLDDRLAKHRPDTPSFMSEITIGHLVYMTSGLPEYYTLRSPRGGWRSEDEFTVEDAIGAVYASSALDYEPGTLWSYSNINYQLLAEAVAATSGVSFAAYVDRNIFRPLGMADSWVDAPIDSSRTTRAQSYVRSDAKRGWQEAPRRSPHYGGSGIYASLNDLAKWDRALYTDFAFGEAFTRRMLSTRRFAHDKHNDAFGLVHGSYRGLATIWYEGGDYGVSTFFMRLPERKETIICLANFADAACGSKVHAIVDMLLASDLKPD